MESIKIYKTFSFRFYAELNDFLPEHRKQQTFEVSFKTPITVGETIESLGIPLAEVDLVIVNGASVSLNHTLHEQDRIAVYPVFESMDISDATQVRDQALRNPKFILDSHLGKLAKYLRMLGFDTLYQNNYEDAQIIQIATEQHRIILTRDKPMLRSKQITHGYFVRAIDPKFQIKEIVQRFDLKKMFEPFKRCMKCNTLLEKVDKQSILDRLDVQTARLFEEFFLCPNCDKIYWKGSHANHM